MTFVELVPQKVVDTQSAILKTRLNPREVLLQGENLKRKLFKRLRFLEPKTENIQLVGFEKSYEPYMIIGGSYSIDYYKKHVFAVEVGEQTREIFIAGKKYNLPPSKPGDPSPRAIHLTGEEAANYSKTTYYLLDKFRRTVPLETIPLAPYEDKTEPSQDANLNPQGFKTSVDADIEFLQTKIAKRPADVSEVIREVFEITERTIVYCPIYELTFQNIKTGKDVTLHINAVNGRIGIIKSKELHKTVSSPQPIEPFQPTLPVTQPRPSRNEHKHLNTKESLNEAERIQKPTTTKIVKPSNMYYSEENTTCDFPATVKGEVLTVGDNVTAVIGDMEIPPGTTVNELLVVKGNLNVGDKCRILRKLKALGDITLGSEVIVNADMISGRNVDIGANSTIRGSVKARGRIHVHENVTFQRESHKKTIIKRKSFEPEFFVATEAEKDQSLEAYEP